MSYGFFYLLIYFVMLSKFLQLSKIQILNINKLDNSFYKDLLNNLHFIDFFKTVTPKYSKQVIAQF